MHNVLCTPTAISYVPLGILGYFHLIEGDFFFYIKIFSEILIFLYHQADANSCAKHVETLLSDVSSQMKMLKETVQSKTAVPAATVFVSCFVLKCS